MNLAALVADAARQGASDLHLQSGQAAALRVGGELVRFGPPLSPAAVSRLADEVLTPAERAACEARRSADLAATLGGVRCRINVLHSAAGLGLAVRLLPATIPTLAGLNLHPELARLVEARHGLVLVSGPSGSGKSSTLAALLGLVNRTRACHVVTIEQPVEFALPSDKAVVRQREVGRDTPSIERALLDALREDVDVLMVGELRERETMRLTLDACETGHLVLATLHSSSTIEALQRMISAFPAGEQPSVCAQLADVLVGVVCQRLPWRDEAGRRVPECEVLLGTTPVRSIVRQGQLYKLASALETGAGAGLFTFERYRRWLDEKEDWHAVRAPRPATRPRAADASDVIRIDPVDQPLSDILDELEER